MGVAMRASAKHLCRLLSLASAWKRNILVLVAGQQRCKLRGEPKARPARRLHFNLWHVPRHGEFRGRQWNSGTHLVSGGNDWSLHSQQNALVDWLGASNATNVRRIGTCAPGVRPNARLQAPHAIIWRGRLTSTAPDVRLELVHYENTSVCDGGNKPVGHHAGDADRLGHTRASAPHAQAHHTPGPHPRPTTWQATNAWQLQSVKYNLWPATSLLGMGDFSPNLLPDASMSSYPEHTPHGDLDLLLTTGPLAAGGAGPMLFFENEIVCPSDTDSLACTGFFSAGIVTPSWLNGGSSGSYTHTLNTVAVAADFNKDG
jgi:hypothetical protein